MIFDRFARAVERGAPELTDLLRKARLFWFPYRPQDVLPKELESDFAELNRESFHLPFQSIAIEDKASLIFLSDRSHNQTGLKAERDFVEVLSIHAALDNFREGDEATGTEKEIIKRQLQRDWPHGAMIVSWGLLSDMLIGQGPEKNQIAMNATVAGMAWCTPDGKWDPLDGEMKFMDRHDQEALAATVRNVGIAMQEVMFFNQPCRFILECTPEGVRRKKRNPKTKTGEPRIPREHERSKYTLLKPSEIRKVLHLPAPESGGPKVRPHERRRHFRHLRSEKFVHKRWQTVVIPASWIGKAETKIGKRRYKVLLDK